MLSGTDFVKKIKEGNKELFEASRSNVRRFFNSNPSDEYLVEHFRGRMVNEAQNMYAIAGQVASADPSTDCLLYTSPSPRDVEESRMPSSA